MSENENGVLCLGDGVVMAPRAGRGFKGAVFARDLPADIWQDVGRRLQEVDGSLQWLWGDWINYGEARVKEELAKAEAGDEEAIRSVSGYGQKYKAALELTELE